MSEQAIQRGQSVILRSDDPDNPRRVGTVLAVFDGQYAHWGKTFATVRWTYQRRYLTRHKGDTQRGTLQTKALVPYDGGAA